MKRALLGENLFDMEHMIRSLRIPLMRATAPESSSSATVCVMRQGVYGPSLPSFPQRRIDHFRIDIGLLRSGTPPTRNAVRTFARLLGTIQRLVSAPDQMVR